MGQPFGWSRVSSRNFEKTEREKNFTMTYPSIEDFETCLQAFSRTVFLMVWLIFSLAVRKYRKFTIEILTDYVINYNNYGFSVRQKPEVKFI